MNFLHPTEKGFWPPETSQCASYPGQERKKKTDPHQLFRGGDFGVREGGQKQATLGHQKLSSLRFPALRDDSENDKRPGTRSQPRSVTDHLPLL